MTQGCWERKGLGVTGTLPCFSPPQGEVRDAGSHRPGAATAWCPTCLAICLSHGLKMKVPPWWSMTYPSGLKWDTIRRPRSQRDTQVIAHQPFPGWSALPSQLPHLATEATTLPQGTNSSMPREGMGTERGSLVTDRQPETHFHEATVKQGEGRVLGM